MKCPEGNKLPCFSYLCMYINSGSASWRKENWEIEKKFGKWSRQTTQMRVRTKQNSDFGNNTVCVLEDGVCSGLGLGRIPGRCFGEGDVYLLPNLRLRGRCFRMGRLRCEVWTSVVQSHRVPRLQLEEQRRAVCPAGTAVAA